MFIECYSATGNTPAPGGLGGLTFDEPETGQNRKQRSAGMAHGNRLLPKSNEGLAAVAVRQAIDAGDQPLVAVNGRWGP
jgi:hypothetical protein